MSKPIIVVGDVIVVVVLVKKKLCPQNLGQTNLDAKKIFGSKKNVVKQKFWVQRNVTQKKFDPKNF